MRRRRSSGRWFPNTGMDYDNGDVLTRVSNQELQLDVDDTDVGTMVVTGLTFDETISPSYNANETDLQSFIGNEYLLKRIVGKCHIACLNLAAVPSHQVKVTAGFFVARRFEPGTDVTIGQLPMATLNNYGPGYAANIDQPWIWRRSWILQNIGQIADSSWGVWPSTNAGYGSVLDGPHIDAKTKRRVAQDARLYFIAQAWAWPLNFRRESYAGTNPAVLIDLDYRIFAQPRQQSRKSGSF